MVVIEVVLTVLACLAIAVLFTLVVGQGRRQQDDPERRSRWRVEFVATGERWTTMAVYNRAEIESWAEPLMRVLGRAD